MDEFSVSAREHWQLWACSWECSMPARNGKRAETSKHDGRQAPQSHRAGSVGRYSKRTGRLAALVLLVVGGGFCFAAWLQAELNPRLHPHSTVVGRVVGASDAALSAPSHVTSLHAPRSFNAPEEGTPALVIQLASGEGAAPADVPQRAYVDKLQPAHQPVKSQISSRRFPPRNPTSAPSTKEDSRAPPFMSTFAHH